MTFGFPVLDGDRNSDDIEQGRVVIHEMEPIEPRIPETDNWCEMPVRIVHSAGDGYCIEIGPYTLDISDILTLRRTLDKLDSIKVPRTR